MSLVLDASVLVSASRSDDLFHAQTLEFVRQIQLAAISLYCPSLVLPECAGAIGRGTKDSAFAARVCDQVKSLSALELTPLDLDLAERAAQLAGTLSIRGADAVYLALAEETASVLITWDRELLNRGQPVAPVQTPEEWCASGKRE